MSSELDRVLLGKVATIEMGQSPPGASYNQTGDGLPLLNGPTEFGGRHPSATQFTTQPTKVCRAGDVLFCVRGSTTGRMNIADTAYCLGRGVAAIRGRTAADTSFIFATLRAELRSLLAVVSGSTFPNLSRADLQGFSLSWPEETQRRRVTAVLAAFDDKIDYNQILSRRCAETASAIFRVGFESWSQTATLGDLAYVDRDVIGAGEGSGTPYIGLDQMPEGSPVLTDWLEDGPAGQSVRFERGDLLFGKLRPYFKKVGVAPIDGRGSTEILVVRPLDDVLWGVVAGYLTSDRFIRHCMAYARGTRMPRVEWPDARLFPVRAPSHEQALEVTSRIKPLFELVVATTHETRRLSLVRDALFPKIVSGQIRVLESFDPSSPVDAVVDASELTPA